MGMLGLVPGTLYIIFNPDGIPHPDRFSTGPWLQALKYTPLPHLMSFVFGVVLAEPLDFRPNLFRVATCLRLLDQGLDARLQLVRDGHEFLHLLWRDLQHFPDVVLTEGEAALLLKRHLTKPIPLFGLEHVLQVFGELLQSILPVLIELLFAFRPGLGQ